MVIDYSDLLHLLREDFDEGSLKEFFETLESKPVLANRTTHQRWCLFELGITIYFDQSFDSVWQVDFVGEGNIGFGDGYYKGFQAFKGRLPGEAQFGDIPEIVESKMKACQWKKLSTVYERPPVAPPDDRNEWPRFLADQKKIRRVVTTQTYKADMLEFSFSFNERAENQLYRFGMYRYVKRRR